MKQERFSDEQLLMKFHFRMFYSALIGREGSKVKAKQIFANIRKYYQGALDLFRSHNIAKMKTIEYYNLEPAGFFRDRKSSPKP